jgi:hypothetical protein
MLLNLRMHLHTNNIITIFMISITPHILRKIGTMDSFLVSKTATIPLGSTRGRAGYALIVRRRILSGPSLPTKNLLIKFLHRIFLQDEGVGKKEVVRRATMRVGPTSANLSWGGALWGPSRAS